MTQDAPVERTEGSLASSEQAIREQAIREQSISEQARFDGLVSDLCSLVSEGRMTYEDLAAVAEVIFPGIDHTKHPMEDAETVDDFEYHEGPWQLESLVQSAMSPLILSWWDDWWDDDERRSTPQVEHRAIEFLRVLKRTQDRFASLNELLSREIAARSLG